MIVHTQQLEARSAFFSDQADAQAPLPPSERDFQVFERVVIEAATTRRAAEEFGLSQTRVMQIRERVAEWIGSQVPLAPRLTARQRLNLASTIAEQRTDFLYSQAMEAWRASQGTQTVVRCGESGETTITRESFGDIKYLWLASRITERKFSVVKRTAEAMREGEQDSGFGVQGSGGNRGQEAGDRNQESGDRGQEFASPPIRDCSRSVEPRRDQSPVVADADDARHLPPEVCEEIENRRRAFLAALADDTAPVQPPRTDAGGLLLDEHEGAEVAEMSLADVLPLAAGAESLAGTSTAVQRPLTRHERRARQRLLDRKLRRKAK